MTGPREDPSKEEIWEALHYADTIWAVDEGQANKIRTLAAAYRSSQAELKEFEEIFEMQRKRTVEADMIWQKAHDKPTTFPDLGELIAWLLKRADDAEKGWQCGGPDERLQKAEKERDSLTERLKAAEMAVDAEEMLRMDWNVVIEDLEKKLREAESEASKEKDWRLMAEDIARTAKDMAKDFKEACEKTIKERDALAARLEAAERVVEAGESLGCICGGISCML